VPIVVLLNASHL